MAEISSEALREILERVTNEVLRETQGHEARAFEVGDFREQLGGLPRLGGGARAWKISGSYSTFAGPSVESSAVTERAWKIEASYDTSSGSTQKGKE
jgi:hypothetical protein